jgi:Fe2+ or Zn2+ uptake regulation protein
MAGIPPGSADAVLSVLRSSGGPIRRRKILAELEGRGHRISLAGLNRILEHCSQNGWITESSDGVQLKAPPG